jgi:hypothetical protein
VRLGRIALVAGKTLTVDAARPGRVGRLTEATVTRAKKTTRRKKTRLQEQISAV